MVFLSLPTSTPPSPHTYTSPMNWDGLFSFPSNWGLQILLLDSPQILSNSFHLSYLRNCLPSSPFQWHMCHCYEYVTEQLQICSMTIKIASVKDRSQWAQKGNGRRKGQSDKKANRCKKQQKLQPAQPEGNLALFCFSPPQDVLESPWIFFY